MVYIYLTELKLFFLARSCFGKTKDSACLTIVSNYSSITESLEHIIDSAQVKYNVGAYLHWYEKYGVEKVCCYCYLTHSQDVLLLFLLS